jgi:imidazolonepropionase-like amidohydrolase
MNSFRQAVAAGVRVAMGTDSGVGEHGRNARELGLMVEGGLTPMQALVAATSDAARLLYPNNPPVGILQPGKIADLLLVTRDPLRDVCVLENQTDIKLIVRNGAIYKSTL